jgi:Na+-transporting NADH:ubiquinone oxidoreductase subunit A
MFQFHRTQNSLPHGVHVKEISEASVASAALVGADFPGIHPSFKVAEGEHVKVGEVLFTDRARPRICFVAPMDGRVETIEFGARRTLSALVIRSDTENVTKDGTLDPIDVGTSDKTLREGLLSSGLWPSFRTRPFGNLPDPDSVPRSIFVHATDSEPYAIDPRMALENQEEAFHRGVELLTRLTNGAVYICQSPGPVLATKSSRIKIFNRYGPHPAGLVGACIHAVEPVELDRQIWTIDAQDVVAIGRFADTGCYDPSRIVALTGPRAAPSRLLRTVPGASIRDLCRDELGETAPLRVFSGSTLSGREAAWLGRYHRQITLQDAEPESRQRTSLIGRARNPSPCPIIPTRSVERGLPSGFFTIPLMRALAVRDSESAARLGAHGLVEEDVALLSNLCTSGSDYGKLLRNVLDDLAEQI